MIIKFLEDLLHWNEEEEVLDAEYEPFRDQLSMAGHSIGTGKVTSPEIPNPDAVPAHRCWLVYVEGKLEGQLGCHCGTRAQLLHGKPGSLPLSERHQGVCHRGGDAALYSRVRV